MRKAPLLVSFAALSQCISAWTPVLQSLSLHHISRRSPSSSIVLEALPSDFQDIGKEIIQEAGASCGMKCREDLDIEWKAGRIIVTVRGKVYVSNPDKVGESDEEVGEESDEESEEESEEVPSGAVSGVDITQLARAINFAMGEDEIGSEIVETHEVEVTTPGASDELSGIMWEAYRGFDVICRFEDPKKKKVTEIAGRLHSRTEEITTINIKGRMKKIKNEAIESVKLPKAKTEKGVK